MINLLIEVGKFRSYGKSEYTSENWQDCVGFMRRAYEDFNYYRDEMLWCRQKCGMRIEGPTEINELSLMFSGAQRALCLLRCRQDKFTNQRPPLSNYHAYEDFMQRKPHFYMQLCYWKLNDLENAVKSAYTYLVAHPDDKLSLENIHFYMDQKGFKHEMLIDLLQRPYETHYMKAVQAYNDQNFKLCIEEFNQGMDAFLKEEESCRSQCEDSLDWSAYDGDNPEISVVITSIYSSVLRCKVQCADQLSIVNGRRIPKFMASFFEYQHICEFNVDRGVLVSQSVANALLLDPDNILMRRNKFFYLKLYGKPELFQPSLKIIEFHKRAVLEKRFLNFVDQRFKFEENGELPPEHVLDRKALNQEIELDDYFDYTRLETTLLEQKECLALFVAAKLDQPVAYSTNLLQELQNRIFEQYGQQPKHKLSVCSEEMQKSGCRRGAFVVSVDKDRCGAVLADEFNGCAVAFCVNE
ncbi:hypothetical protein M3Y97_00945100 [Aphelenchoides bicaudatus]|nr:hypothetical protein M3Y97_00945100 [Aphelenchoides bicaudatus]